MIEVALPPNWLSKRLKYLATYNDEVLAESTDEEKEIDYIQISGVSLPHGIERTESMTFGEAPSRARRKVKSGDILISTVWVNLRAIATVEDASPDLIASTGFCVVRPNDDMDSGFLGWVAKSEPFVAEIVARSVGVIYPAINPSELVTIDMPLPPLDTQRRIARFLDEKTRKINELIKKKQKLLKCLAEKRQSFIIHAVTKGIKPDDSIPRDLDQGGYCRNSEENGEMKFITQTPKDWTRSNVGKYCEVQLGKMLQNDSLSERDELKPYLRAINIGKEGLDLSHEFSMWIRSQEINVFRLKKGDVLVSEGGDAGRTAIFDADGEYYFQNAINRVRPNYNRKIEPMFIYYWFNFLKVIGYVAMICNVATIPHFTAEKVKAAPLVFPPLDMQQRIVRFLDEKTEKTDNLQNLVVQSIDKLTEYRSALITAAVTGQLTEMQ